MGRIFGTDGARGVANTEISCTLAMDIGRAAAMVVARDHHKRKPVFWLDTIPASRTICWKAPSRRDFVRSAQTW